MKKRIEDTKGSGYKIRSYESLTFTDDFIFWKVLTNNPELCRQMIEIILGIKVSRVKVILPQKEIKLTPDAHGVRLDVYVSDSRHTVYDIEMQMTKRKNLPKRMRYYQGMIDLHLIESGKDYQRLRKSYVIFICPDDYFHKGRSVYRFANLCRGDPTIELDDKAEKVVLNAAGSRNGLPPELSRFLDYIRDHKPGDRFTEKLEQAVSTAKDNPKWRMEFMTYEMNLKEQYQIGYEKGEKRGKKIGEEQGGLKMLYELVCKGKMTISDAADLAAKFGVKDTKDFRNRAALAGYTLPE